MCFMYQVFPEIFTRENCVFVQLFNTTIETSEKNPNLAQRLEICLSETTMCIYKNVARQAFVFCMHLQKHGQVGSVHCLHEQKCGQVGFSTMCIPSKMWPGRFLSNVYLQKMWPGRLLYHLYTSKYVARYASVQCTSTKSVARQASVPSVYQQKCDQIDFCTICIPTKMWPGRLLYSSAATRVWPVCLSVCEREGLECLSWECIPALCGPRKEWSSESDFFLPSCEEGLPLIS